jgi:hypothetical protein
LCSPWRRAGESQSRKRLSTPHDAAGEFDMLEGIQADAELIPKVVPERFLVLFWQYGFPRATR